MISVSISVSDPAARASLRATLDALAAYRPVDTDAGADVVLTDAPRSASRPFVRVGPDYLAADCAPSRLSDAIDAALADSTRRQGAGAVVACWSPKGGVGTTSFALNLAAAAHARGHGVAYADLDHRWGDGATFFGRFDDSADADADSSATGVRPLVHACGLKGFVATSADDVDALTGGLRTGFELGVVDVPSYMEPSGLDADVVLLLVGCDLMSVRRCRHALDVAFGGAGDVRAVVSTRRGAELGVEDVEAVLGNTAAAVLVDEPALVGWSDRGAFMYALRRSRWSREIRALAAGLCAELVDDTTSGRSAADDAPEGDAFGRLAERLRA